MNLEFKNSYICEIFYEEVTVLFYRNYKKFCSDYHILILINDKIDYKNTPIIKYFDKEENLKIFEKRSYFIKSFSSYIELKSL